MITKKIGWIGCGNMGGAILHGALKSGVLAKENAMVYDVSPAAMEKAEGWGVLRQDPVSQRRIAGQWHQFLFY